MSSPLNVNEVKDDQEFEWLLSLAATTQAPQLLQTPEVAEALQPNSVDKYTATMKTMQCGNSSDGTQRI